jgi:type IV secretion system protein VirB10
VLLELLMESKKLIWALAMAQVMIFSGVAQAQQPAVLAQRVVSEPYEVAQGTFLNLTLERVDPDYVSAMLYENVYDDYENVAIPRGSRLFGRQVNKVNESHDVYFTQLQLSSTGQMLTLGPPLQATSPLGAAGLTNFKPAAIAGTIWRKVQVMPH